MNFGTINFSTNLAGARRAVREHAERGIERGTDNERAERGTDNERAEREQPATWDGSMVWDDTAWPAEPKADGNGDAQ